MNELPKILIIDDDVDLLETYATVLSEKYNVETAKDGAEAIKKSMEKHFNAALIDIVLPDMTGIELLGKLGSGTPKLRKIIITGYATTDNAISALNLGADAFVIKPVAPNALLKIISDQLVGQQREIRLIQEKVDDLVTKNKYKEKEYILEDVINNVDFGVEVWGQKEGSDNFMLISSNPAAERLTGISEKEKMGKGVDEVYSTRLMQNIHKLLMEVMDSGKAKTVSIYCVLPLSQRQDLLMRVSPLRKRFVTIILRGFE